MQRAIPSRILAVLGLCAAVALSGCGGAQARKAKHLEKGQAYLTAGNLDKARVEFQNALQIAPTDPEARFESGVVLEKMGKIREAAQLYQGAIDVSPDHLAARTHLARLYVLSAVPEKALEYLKPALDQHPDNAELLSLRAAAKVQQKDTTGGEVDARRAVELDPGNADAVATLAGIYMSSKETAKAVTLLEEGIRRIPANVDLRLVLAQVYGTQNRPADVERILLELVRLRPQDKSQRIRLAQFYAGQNQVEAAERVLREGLKAAPADRELKLALVDFLAARRSPEVAEKELTAMIAADAGDFELQFALAKFYESSGDVQRAEAVYQRVIDAEKMDSAGLMARDRLALLRAKRNDIPGAEKLIGEVLAKSPRDNEALLLHGNIALERKDPKSAIADLRTVLRDQPNAVPALRTLARAHLANGEPAIAEETMRRALEANPNDAGVRLDLAQLLSQIGKPDQAKPIVAELVKQQPGNVAALDAQFRICAALKDYAGAQAAAEALTAADPKSGNGYYYQGTLAEAQNRNDEALRLYGKAADLRPDSYDPLQAQIRLLVKSKRVPEAIKRLDAVTASSPTVALAPNMKGQLLLEEGRFSEAQDAFKAAITRMPKWWSPYRGLAFTQFAVKDVDGAVATLRNAQATADRPDLLGIEIASYYERAGDADKAIREYEAVLRSAPQSDPAANNLAMLLVTFKKDPASIDRAKALAARFAESVNPSYLDTYGWVLFKHGEAAASVPVLERVVSKEPDVPLALYHLGMAQSQAGNTTEAVGNLSRAVKSGAKFSGLDEARAVLDKLAKPATDPAAKI